MTKKTEMSFLPFGLVCPVGLWKDTKKNVERKNTKVSQKSVKLRSTSFIAAIWR